MITRCIFLTALIFGMCWVSFGQYTSPTDSGSRIHMVAPTTRPWYEPDDSLMSLNAGLGFENADWMIRNMKRGLIGERCPLVSTLPGTREYITEISDALHRSGDSPEITNVLHQALLFQTNLNCSLALRTDGVIKASPPDSIKTNLFRDIILHAYIMASPVPMTILAETVVKEFPPEERDAWYARARSKKLRAQSWIDRSIDRPSREALRYSHFLNLIKAIETDPERLRGFGDIVDPKWECQQERKDEK